MTAAGIYTGRLLVGVAIAVGAVVTMYSDQPGPYRQLEEIIGQCAEAMWRVADALRTERAPDALAPLRAAQRQLVELLGAHAETGIAGELAGLSDRLVDNINTLAHVVGRAALPAAIARTAGPDPSGGCR